MLISHKKSFALRVMLLFCLTCTLAGCKREKRESEDVIRTVDALYERYRIGDVNEAKESMHRAIAVLENAGGKITEEFRLRGLGMAYSRLFYLAQAEGDQDAATSAFLTAKKCFYKEFEVKGLSDDEIKKTLEQMTQETLAQALSDGRRVETGCQPLISGKKTVKGFAGFIKR